jgi:hypothetical protein
MLSACSIPRRRIIVLLEITDGRNLLDCHEDEQRAYKPYGFDCRRLEPYNTLSSSSLFSAP